jgi:hypothetical protein
LQTLVDRRGRNRTGGVESQERDQFWESH